jgi:hypothetical protein
MNVFTIPAISAFVSIIVYIIISSVIQKMLRWKSEVENNAQEGAWANQEHHRHRPEWYDLCKRVAALEKKK